MSEYQMLNNTLIEMMEKGSSDVNIDLMKKDIAEKQEAIDTLKDWIQEKIEDDEDSRAMKNSKSTYNAIKKKPRLAKSIKLNTNLYDSIKKETSTPKEYGKEDYSTACGISKPSKDKEYGEYDTPYNHLHYEEEYEKEIIENYNKQTVDNFPLKDQYEDVTYSNRFLVRFGTQFRIPEWYVRKVSFFSPQGKEFGIRVLDFVDVKTNRPIIADILGMLNNVDALPFKISIDHLDPTGHVLYTEHYHGCRIQEVMRNELSYEKDDMNTIDMIITYSDVSYETQKL